MSKVKWGSTTAFTVNLQFTLDDQKIVVVGDKNIVTYDAKTGNVLQKMDDASAFSGGFPDYKTRFSALSPSARYAVMWQGNLKHNEGFFLSSNIWVIVWDLQKKQIIGRQGKMQSKFKNCSAVFTPDEKHVLLGSMDGNIRDWSIAEQKTVREWKVYGIGMTSDERDPAPHQINSMVFSSEGRYLATIGPEPKIGFAVRVFDYSTTKLLREFVGIWPKNAMCFGYPMAFSPDGKYFALGKNRNLCLYDTETWKEKWCISSRPDDKSSK